MKKLYSFVFASALALMSFNANATMITVQVGAGGNTFTPSTFTAVVGDVVRFTLAGGVHDVTGLSVPSGAAAIMSGTMTSVGQNYDYTVTVAGNYGYYCSIHGTSMIGGFSASATNITEANVDLSTTAYPNPFMDKVNFKFNGVSSIEIVNMVGAKVKTVNMTSVEGKVEVDFEGIPAGVYFFRTYKDGVIVETKKIVKSK
jgi:plastocyanin